MVAAQKRYNKVVQVGQWQRSDPHWKDAVKYLHDGNTGRIRSVRAWSYVGWKSSIPVLPDAEVPAGVNYDMWLGPAPKRPFNKNRFHQKVKTPLAHIVIHNQRVLKPTFFPCLCF